VDLVTQEAKAGGKGLKESFQIKVFDNERGGTARDLDALSGGEKVIRFVQCVLSSRPSIMRSPV